MEQVYNHSLDVGKWEEPIGERLLLEVLCACVGVRMGLKSPPPTPQKIAAGGDQNGVMHAATEGVRGRESHHSAPNP